MTENFTPKSFWQRPEGTAGMIVATVGVLGVVWGVTMLLPFIVWAMSTAITAALLTVVAACLLTLLASRRFWTLGGYMFKSAMRRMTGWFIEIDPIGILRNYIADLHRSLETMEQQITALAGQRDRLAHEMQRNERDVAEALTLSRRARAAKKETLAVVQGRQAVRLTKSNRSLAEIAQKIDFLYRFLTKTQETSQALVQDMELEVKEQERQRELVATSVSVIRTAQRIMRGDPDRRELWDQTMEFLAADYSQKVGEIQRFIEMSGSAIDRMDLDQGVWDEEALKMIEELEAKSPQLLVAEQPRDLVEIAAPADKVAVPAAKP